ncbi:hypothetical protein KCU85_g1859, partial [Aureobasidium melanogenum]
MAVAAFWDVSELKMKVFKCLRDDGCDADLARCARVHGSWTDLALNTLWLGYSRAQDDDDSNRKRTEAIALLPRGRRQDYASRISVLDFSKLHGKLVHTMFDRLKFTRLKEIILSNVENDEPNGYRLSKYLQPTLESLKLVDKSRDEDTNWLTSSFLADVAKRCPGLNEVFLWAPYTPIDPVDLVQFFRSIQPRVVSLDFGEYASEVLTYDVLSTLSHGGCLASLIFVPNKAKYSDIEVDHLQRFLDATRDPFPSLKRLELVLEENAVRLIPQCFPTITWLRLDVTSYLRDESILKPIANMSQLQILEIVGDGDRREYNHTIPARAFIPLGSLSQLKSLKIGTSFYPSCMLEEDSEDREDVSPDDKFLESDASDMFSGLTSLEHLSINALDYADHDHHLWESISSSCPRLSSIEFVGSLDLWSLILPNAPLFENLTDMAVEQVRGRMTLNNLQAVRMIDNFAPKLRRLRCTSDCPFTQDLCTLWAEFRTTQEYFKLEGASRIEELRMEVAVIT